MNQFKQSSNIQKPDIEIKNTSLNITVFITFGMPTKDCTYNGICRITSKKKQKKTTIKCASIADISISNKNRLLFKFRKNEMHLQTIKKHFRSGYFIILEDYTTPDFVIKALGQCTTVIRQGVYPIKETDNYYEVIF